MSSEKSAAVCPNLNVRQSYMCFALQIALFNHFVVFIWEQEGFKLREIICVESYNIALWKKMVLIIFPSFTRLLVAISPNCLGH